MAASYSPPILSFTDMATSISELHQAHAHMLKTGLIHDTYAASRLITLAAVRSSQPLALAYAHSIFSRIDHPNSYIWNTMIRAYANSADPQGALHMYFQMLHSSAAPDNYTYPFVLKACSALQNLNEGQQVHGHVVKNGNEDDVYVLNTLINMYASCGCFKIARNVLDKMPEKDVISWNAMLSAYVESGLMDLARHLFDEMGERNLESWNFMVSGYAGAGLVGEAKALFDEMPSKDIISWNAMMSGYARAGLFSEVLVLFENMQNEKLKADNYTLVNVLSACANLAALSQGEWVHAYIGKNRISIEGFLATALVDMYSKCGNIGKALAVFRSTLKKDTSTWNSIISGLSSHGCGELAINKFYEMLEDGYKPNEVTFVSVLSACSRAGLLVEGRDLFELMIHAYEIQPTIEHYGCMVDLLARVGLVEEAEAFLKTVPVKEAPVLWESLLAACRDCGNVDLGQRVAKKLLELDPEDTSGYVQLSNVYASTGKWKDVAQVRKIMKSQGMKKEPGSSMIEIDGVVHEFLAGEGFEV